MHDKLVCCGAKSKRERERERGREEKKSQLVNQREGVLKLLDKDMFNWAVDNSFFSRFTGRHSAALKSVVKRGIKGWVGVTCKEHKRTQIHIDKHTLHTEGSHGSGGTWRQGLNLFNCSPH